MRFCCETDHPPGGPGGHAMMVCVPWGLLLVASGRVVSPRSVPPAPHAGDREGTGEIHSTAVLVRIAARKRLPACAMLSRLVSYSV